MTTLADKAILSGADNRPPMLEKDMYDSWKSRMELYMMNRQLGRMILESVENGPLIWPSIEKNGVTRPKKYFELSATEATQADCDVKSANIILQGIPPQERECKLYDEFDKFAYKKGETLLRCCDGTFAYAMHPKTLRSFRFGFFPLIASYGVVSSRAFVGTLFRMYMACLTASAQKSCGISIAFIMHLVVDMMVLFLLSTTPFCCGE
nr:hypothetical protein [Tanacetum cinerariifolium]